MNDLLRNNLPIPHREHVGLTTYDALKQAAAGGRIVVESGL
jgi:hypothetical protein